MISSFSYGNLTCVTKKESNAYIISNEKECYSTQSETEIVFHFLYSKSHIGKLEVFNDDGELVFSENIELNPDHAIFTVLKSKLGLGNFTFKVISELDDFQNTFVLK